MDSNSESAARAESTHFVSTVFNSSRNAKTSRSTPCRTDTSSLNKRVHFSTTVVDTSPGADSAGLTRGFVFVFVFGRAPVFASAVFSIFASIATGLGGAASGALFTTRSGDTTTGGASFAEPYSTYAMSSSYRLASSRAYLGTRHSGTRATATSSSTRSNRLFRNRIARPPHGTGA